MSLFNLRRASTNASTGGGLNAGGNAPTENLDTIRKRAKHRLIGAAVLVLAGVVGFPLLFDTQPRPIAVDIPIEIPAKNAVKPLVMPARIEAAAVGAQADQSDKSAASKPVIVKPYPEATLPTAALPAMAAVPVLPAMPAKPKAPVNDKVSAAASLSDQEEILNDKKSVANVQKSSAAIKKEVKSAAKVDLKPEAKPESKPVTKPESKLTKPSAGSDDGARAKALLEGGQSTVSPTSATTAARSERLVVQVGAFADVDKAHEIRLKLEKAGLKTYTQVTETAAGKRIRVRVGPFASKADADKAASKIKTLDLSATVLTL